MLTQEENNAVTQVEGDASMAQLMERYWLPATRSAELEADGAPQRIRLLGRNLVAFRNTEGEVGVLDEHCPHRGASLALARNENCTLQCLYHGWRIAPDGELVETPSEPENSTFKDRVRANAYPVWEAGGLVWTYLGPAELEPEKPRFDFTELPEEQLMIIKGVEYCNWLQCLEGAVDSAHLNWLHTNITRPDWLTHASDGPDSGGELLANLTPEAPRLEAQSQPYGFRYGAIRPVPNDPDSKYIRATEFVMPFHSNFPGAAGHWAHHQAFVPIDDHNCMFFYIQYKTDGVPIPDEERPAMLEFAGVELDSLEHGRGEARELPSAENLWLQDREAMKNGTSFSGLRGINNEDFVVQESMSPIYDRTREHLGMSDVAVIRLRRVLLESLRKLAAGEAPSGLAEPVPYPSLRGGEGIIPKATDWWTVLKAESDEPAGKVS
ncbi:aromatic ring-hydroxylating dioxygenase subunit alpha [Aeromicrobium sp. YIM 150415]|uniref:Rieske 2Fe-2S domain-containing protein n=1 Tax=Aeromicrobium sp. YIM 150415 TaxID=2803912 RepID=UPI0019655B59|nr:Rieske 2Fe-2S domain-containing protein [Aeromicrobium sp. YIM 150415]MBM9463568.1 aromatic ring-hydroxylating dioxygenase subunit alpha [Aeromicrobium sp. YIM 150415]